MKFHSLALLVVCSGTPTAAFVSSPSSRTTPQPPSWQLGTSTQQVATDPYTLGYANVAANALDSASSLQEKTDLFLSDKFEIGSLPENVLSNAMQVLNECAWTGCSVGAQTAAAILQRLEQEEEAGNSAIELDTVYYCAVVNAWSKSEDEDSGLKAEQLLDLLTEKSKTNVRFLPNRIVFNAVMHAWIRQGDLERAQAIFERMKEDPTIEMEVADYHAILLAHGRLGNARAAETLLKEILESSSLDPDIVSYNCVLDAWRHSNEPGAEDRAGSILKTLQTKFDNGESDIRPNGISYSTVVATYNNSDRDDAVEYSERLIALAEEYGVANDTFLYNQLLDALASRGQEGDAEKAQEKLEEMESMGMVNSVSYNVVIKAWHLSNVSNAGERAEAILKRMHSLNEQDSSLNIRPDVVTYTSAIQSYTASKGGAAKAVALFEQMLDLCRNGNEDLKPNTYTANVVLDALAKDGDGRSATMAYDLLIRLRESCSSDSCFELIALNSISFTSVIDAFAKSGSRDCARKADRCFQLMEEEYERGNYSAKPTTRAYNALLNAWVQCGEQGSAQQAQALIDRMEKEVNEGNVQVRPDVVSYSIVMNGWVKSKSPDAVERTASLFTKMVSQYKAGHEEARPNTHAYVSLISAILQSNRQDAPAQAEKILRHMFDDYTINGNAGAKPNTQVFTDVMTGWARSKSRMAGQRAENLLDWMIDLSKSDPVFRPNQMTWSAVINAWAKARVFGKASRAKGVLDRMVSMYEESDKLENDAKPNTIVYTAVVNAAAYTMGNENEKRSAFNIATSTMQGLGNSKYGKPNHVTYSSYLTACRNLISDDASRASTAEDAFRKCCQEGMVNDLVVQRATSVLDGEIVKLFPEATYSPEGRVVFEKIPSEWSRNVVASGKGRFQKWK